MATKITLAKHTSTYRLVLRYNNYDLIIHMLKLLQFKGSYVKQYDQLGALNDSLNHNN